MGTAHLHDSLGGRMRLISAPSSHVRTNLRAVASANRLMRPIRYWFYKWIPIA